MNDNALPFSARSFVSETVRDSETMATFPDNRPAQPRIYITSAVNITKEEINTTFAQLYTPWKPEQPVYTVKDWRRSVMFSQLPNSPPAVPSVSEMLCTGLEPGTNTPRSAPATVDKAFTLAAGGSSSSSSNSSSSNSATKAGTRKRAKRKPKTPYLNQSLKIVGHPQHPQSLSRQNNQHTPHSPRSPHSPKSNRSNRSNRSPRLNSRHHRSPLSPSSLSNSSLPTTTTNNATPNTTQENNYGQNTAASGIAIVQQKIGPTIEMLERQSYAYLGRNQYLQAVQCQKKAIAEVTKLFGLSSQKIRGCCEKYIVMCNSSAMKMLEQKKYDLSLELLEKSSDITQRNGPLQRHNESRMKFRSTTMNNLGCYWKNKREYGRALKYLQKAASLESKMMSISAQCDSPATTHLNICSVLSALGRHAQARDHACAALEVLSIEMDRAIQGGGDIVEAEQRSMKLRITALYNKAVEEMWLFQYERAEQTYMEGLDEFDEENAGSGGMGGLNTLHAALLDGLKEAQKKIHNRKEEQERMEQNKEEKRARRTGKKNATRGL